MPVNLVPCPVHISEKGAPLSLKSDAAIAVAAPAARGAADLLAGRLRASTGWAVPVREGGKAAVILTGEGAPEPAGGYRLSTGESGAVIRARDAAGFFHGIATLRSLLPVWIEFPGPQVGLKWEAPGVEIEDAPRFGWRGFMIDSGRHFLPVETIKRVIDAISLLKFNRLHWHLTEDQGWRLEIKGYPRLTEVGAWRGPNRYGGFYTASDARGIVEYASARGIEVVPEIEIPGHSNAALAAYPELGCTGGPYEVGCAWGIYKEVFCAGNDKVFELLEAVLSEVCEIFPAGYVHLGADEVPKDRWKACPKCQERIRKEGLKDEHELQSWFVHRAIKYLAGRGKRAICWDEILEGGPPPSVIVQVWRANECAVSKAAAAGREVIHSPYSHVYINESPHSLTLERVHSFEPTVEGKLRDLKPAKLDRPELLLGGEACLWGEWCPPERMGWQMFPRLAAVAERLWSPAGGDYAEFRARALGLADRLAFLGLTPGPES